MALFTGCTPKESKSDAIKMVAEKERSAHFAAVSSQLELGGTLYGYVDIDGDVLKAAPYLRMFADSLAEQQPMAAPFLKQDFAQILKDLGLNDVKAIGLSSVPSSSGGFRNRVFLYTPQGRHGLLSGLGGAPTAFSNARLAPVDADLYAETDIDVAALYAAVRALVVRVAGEPMAGVFETQLKSQGAGMGVAPLSVINSLKGRATVVLLTDAERTVQLPGAQPFTIPAFQFLARVDGLGGSLAPLLEKLPTFTATQAGAVKFYTLKEASPIKGLELVLAVEGTALYVASDSAFLKDALARKDGLAQLPAFREALVELGATGNGVTYLSPRLFSQLQRVKALNPQIGAENLRMLDLVLGGLPESAQPLVAVRMNLPEGVLYRSRWSSSLKQDVATLAVYNPVSVGLLAAMAIPAFQKVRTASQEKAIINNLRQLSAAADQYMLETGKDSAVYSQLVGPGNDKYIRALNPVAGEDYTRLVIKTSTKQLEVTTQSGQTIRWQR